MSVRVYFPNFIFTLIRSGKRRDPNQVVFRVPAILTKIDIREYLTKVYQLAVTNIHTVNFISREVATRRRHIPAYKNAIVTYRGPAFVHPPAPDAALLKNPRPDMRPVKYPTVH